MNISAVIVADSKNESGNRITTMVVTFPRFILAEFNTHRMFSRNSASSRAIPFEKMLKSVEENPFIPIAWQKDHKGMQGSEYLGEQGIARCNINWLQARDNAIHIAKLMAEDSCTKQLCNRLLEPFMWHTVIVTASEYENFFALRCPQYEVGKHNDGKEEYQTFRSKKDAIEGLGIKTIMGDEKVFWQKANNGQAEIHMMALAEAMWDAMNESQPKQLKAGEWHIPFGDCNPDLMHMDNGSILDQRIKIAVARCARISYTVVGEEDKEPNYENDIKLHDGLMKSRHASPFEHCAMAGSTNTSSRNFNGGWKQYREIVNL